MIVLIAPLAAASAILVRLSSPGPIIFSQKRVTRHGRLFDCYKFRTMCRDAEAMLSDPELARQYEVAWKLQDDARVTPVGRWLRKLSIDELPQLVNVLRGDMSVVGPRPVQPRELEQQFAQLKEVVTLVKPGLTSPWAISGRSDLRYEDRVWLDLEYIRNRGFFYDLAIVAKTIPAVLAHRGAV